MKFTRVKIFTTVPSEYAAKVRQALGNAGAGEIGEYTFCSFSVAGTGRFIPSDKANSHIGKPGSLAEVKEEKIEVVCQRSQAKQIIAALKAAHPYEEVAMDIHPLITESEL